MAAVILIMALYLPSGCVKPVPEGINSKADESPVLQSGKWTDNDKSTDKDNVLLNENKEDIPEGPDYSDSIIRVFDINGGKLWAGDILGYEIDIINSGDRYGSSIVLVCPLPGETGYVEDSASAGGVVINGFNNSIEWNINWISKDDKKKYSFEVFVANYVTFENEIKSDFYLKGGSSTIEIDNPSITVSPYAFNTIACMGDSQIVKTAWPDILDEKLENFYPHADFNTVSTAMEGEMVIDAIERFDSDVRIHNPDIIILGYGCNDAGELDALYEYQMDILIRQALSTGASVFVYGIGYIDTTISKWKNKSNFNIFNEILKDKLAGKYDITYVDINTVMSEEPQKYLQADGMHWNSQGADFVATEVFKGLVLHFDKDGKLPVD